MVSDLSQVYQVNDESINVHIPIDHQMAKHTTQVALNTNKYFSYEDNKHSDTTLRAVSFL